MGGILLLDRGLERNAAEWKTEKGANINDPASDYFAATQAPDGTMAVVNGYAGTRKYAGALVANKRALPRYNGALLPWVAMRMRFRWPASLAANLARHELDLKVCVKPSPAPDQAIRNVANFSTQWNAETGMWQIDQDPPAWHDTGFVTEDICAEEWHTVDYRFWFDREAARFSVLSIALDDLTYEIPKYLQDVPMQESNWETVAAVQIQNEMLKPGATMIEYDDIALAWSDQPIEDF